MTIRTINNVDARADGTTLTLSCGHVGEHAQHFTYKIGSEIRCNKCFTNDTLLRKMDRIGDKLADMEMMNGENAPVDWQAKYDALEEEYRELEQEYESRKGN